MPQKPAVWMRTEILSVARGVLRRRNSARIIAISSTKGDVRTLLREYRSYLAETRRLLEAGSVPVTATALEMLRNEWADALAEHGSRRMA
jgi:hypothetical protein